jgi:inosine-uridine nucleoside N-ribohydrolase
MKVPPVRVIVDTDLGADCDDAGALAVLHALTDAGEADFLACVYSSGRNPYGAGGVAAINQYYGRPGIPIGAYPESEIGFAYSAFLEQVATNTAAYGHKVVTRDDVPPPVPVLRRALAAAPDQRVQIVSIGHTKGLYDLLESAPDEHSPLSGRDLVLQKINEWVCMGGTFPQGEKPEWNFGANDAQLYSRKLVEAWPTPVVFTGFELGDPIKTGRALIPTPENNPVRECYRLFDNSLEKGRASWDQTAVLYAVRGARDYWTLRRGRCEVQDDGLTLWHDDPQGPHAYLVQKMPLADITALIDELMARPPKLRL